VVDAGPIPVAATTYGSNLHSQGVALPFKSKAQRRKFAELMVKGEISPETFEEWNRDTGSARLPERAARKQPKKAATKKSVTQKSAAKKSAAKKSAVKKSATKKSAAKKSGARKQAAARKAQKKRATAKKGKTTRKRATVRK
jgi:hypothetical protein